MPDRSTVRREAADQNPFDLRGSRNRRAAINRKYFGYLTVYASWLLTQNKIAQRAASLKAGRLGNVEVRGSEIVLGPPVIINKSNIDQFNF